jgi:hypothetical protein
MLPPPGKRRSRFSEPTVRAPFVCALSDAPWRPLPDRTYMPSASQAAIGDYAWFALGNEPATSAVFVVRSKGGVASDVERVALLGPAPRPQRVAYTFSLQVEGAAALRYETPVAGAGSVIGRVEVAWQNLLEDSHGRGFFTAPGGYRPGDYEDTSETAQRARPALLSIGAGGVFVRIHKALADEQPTYFLDGTRTEVLPPVTWPPFPLSEARSEMAHVDGAFVPLRIGKSAMIRARRDGQG